MAWVLKTDVQSRFDDAAPGNTETLFGALYSLQEDIPVRSVPRARAEELGEVVRAHAGYRRKLREAEIVRQVVADMIKHTLKTISRQTASMGHRCVVACND